MPPVPCVPGNVTLADFFHQIKEKYPEQKLMADCSTIEEAFFADELGFDFIGTTMVGYTPQSRGMKIEANDFEILRTILKKVKASGDRRRKCELSGKGKKSDRTGFLCSCGRKQYHAPAADHKRLCRGCGFCGKIG